jgi:hypothetical protein
MQIHKINQYWREGRYVDLWSINHVLSGIVLGAILFSISVPFVWSLGLSLILFVAWEIGEMVAGIKEHMPNLIMDIVCDVAGFLLIAWWFAEIGPLSWMSITAWILLMVVMNLWGFIAYEERKIDAIPEKLQTHL